MSSLPRLIINHLLFLGPNKDTVGLRFTDGLNLVYGASNTGKSFALKALDFMLGGKADLPDISERVGFDTGLLGFSSGTQSFTVARSLAGGRFTLVDGLQDSIANTPYRTLGQKHDPSSDDNLSRFLLELLGFSDKWIVQNVQGKKRSLSFRDLAHVLLVNETAIQIEQSPIETGQYLTRTAERSVLRLLLTGVDDSAIVAADDKGSFATSKAARIDVLDQLIEDVAQAISDEYPEPDELPKQLARLNDSIEILHKEVDQARAPVRQLLERKRSLSKLIPQTGQRLEEIGVHLQRFSQLDAVFTSDLQRLEAIEEVGFLLSLGEEKPCPVCGATPEMQKHTHSLEEVARTRQAATAEIEKIVNQRDGLAATVAALRREKEELDSTLEEMSADLQAVEHKIVEMLPEAERTSQSLGDLLEKREHVRRGLELLERKRVLLDKRTAMEMLKRPSKSDRPKLSPPGTRMHEFCKTVSAVLSSWEFPGERSVSFDEGAFDLRIDGKLRTDNGKGVRAVTHAAFKVALLIYCRTRGLPHPGFLVLDTPLLAYRDPLSSPDLGALTEDEKQLAQTPLKQRFFEHLHSLGDQAQFIVLENVDPPENIAELATVEVFSGRAGVGRFGLFPPPTHVRRRTRSPRNPT